MKAGFGKCNITLRAGVELYGFGPYLNRSSIGVRQKPLRIMLDGKELPFRMQGNKIELSLKKSGTLEFQFR